MFKKRRIPHTYVIIFYIIILSAILTWIIPGGEYVETLVEKNGTQQKELTFKYVESNAQTWQVFSALFDGFKRQSGIIVLILMIGGAFWIMNTSRAIDVGIFSFLKFTKKLERNKLIKKLGVENMVMVLVMLLFSAFGAIFGMSEETIAFIIILVPLAITMGYDSITGVSLVFVAAGLGFAGAILNPFTIGIAQGISEIPLFTGIEYRFLCWIVINIIGFGFILRYANKVKKNPKSSLVYEEDKYWRDKGNHDIESIKYHTPTAAWISYALILISLIVFAFIYPMTEMKVGNSSVSLPMIPISVGLFLITGLLTLRKSVHFFILSILIFTIYFLIVGVMGYQWYIMKIATLFFAM